MALTVSSLKHHRTGDRDMKFADIAFDSSYAFGGESLTANDVGLGTIERINIAPKNGYTFEYDYTNKKIKAFAPAPIRVVDEVHTIASAQVTLDYPAAYIMNVAATNQHQLLTDTSATLSSNECKLAAQPTLGARPTLTFHASTTGTVYVTYITQAWKDVWDNRVSQEAAAVSTSVATLANMAVGVETVLGSANSYEFVRGGDAAAGATEIEIDFTDTSTTTLTMHGSASTATLTTTYIKKPASGFLLDRFVEDEDLTMSSKAGTAAYPILLQGISGNLPDYTSAGERSSHNLQMNIGDALGTAGEFYINYLTTGQAVAVSDASSDAVSMTYIKGHPWEVPGVVPLEVKNASDLSALTSVKIEVIGY